MDSRTTNSAARDRHLRDYWRVVWNGRWTVIAIFAVVVVLGTVATLLQKPTFEAAAVLEINARPRGVVQGQDVAQLGATEWGYLAEERYFNTQFEIIKSRAVAEQVMRSLDIYSDPAFEKVKDPERAFTNRIIVEPVQETGLVQVKVRAGTPEKAALWANAVAQAYTKRNLAESVRKTEDAVNMLKTRLAPLREVMTDAASSRFDLADEYALNAGEDPQKAFQERLNQLETDHTRAKVARIAVQGLYDKVREIEAAGGDFLVIPRISSDSTIRALAEDRIALETELRRLAVTYKPGHYKVQEKESELEKLQQKIDIEVARVVAAIQTEYTLASDQESQIAAAIEETKRQSVRLGRKATEYEVRTAESQESARFFELINTRIKEVSLNANLLMNNISIVDEAIVPSDPVSPKRRLNVALSGVLGLALGLGTVFFLDYLDNTVKSSEDVEQYLGMSILAIVPRKDAASEKMVKESLQSLRTNVNFSSLNRTRRKLLLTSAGPQEGKTSTLVALARTQASAGDRVVVVDCDLRRPNVHNHLHLKRNFGLTNFLADASEESSWRKYLKTTDIPTLQVLTCGPIPPNPPELFGTDRFRRLVEELSQEFDWVLLDAPPIASLTDSVILASLVDMVVFVIRHRQNDRELIRRSAESIRAVNPHIIGAVLNDVNLDRSHYSDYYYAGHYYYGSEESEGGEPRKRFLRHKSKVG